MGLLFCHPYGNDTWKLNELPQHYDKRLCLSIYFHCTYYLRNSLTELNLTRGTLDRRDFNRLVELKQLKKKIHIWENILKDRYDIESILKFLPKITDIVFKSFQMEIKWILSAHITTTALQLLIIAK
jgi:hypothetical protein